MFPPLDFLCVNHVVLSVCSNETDVNDPIRIVDPHHDPILVARKIEFAEKVFGFASQKGLIERLYVVS